MATPAERFTIALPDPGAVTRVVLEGLGTPLDVSGDHVAISSEPFTIGLCLDASVTEEELRAARLQLVFQDWDAPRQTRGILTLRVREAVALPGSRQRLWVCEVVRSKNYCVGWFKRQSSALDVYYMRPRPVSLVSVMDGTECDIFPADSSGAISSGHFILAQRSTTPAIRLIRHARRLAVSAVSASFKNQRTFGTVTSMEFALPVPREALFVREVEVREIHCVHSHTLFVTDIARVTCSTDDDALCRIAGAYASVRGLESVR